jgi:hypothetical protein
VFPELVEEDIGYEWLSIRPTKAVEEELHELEFMDREEQKVG